MRVILEEDIFASSRVTNLSLCSLIHLGFDERHLIQTQPTESKPIDDWLAQQSENLREECELVLKTGFDLDRNEYEVYSPFTIQVADIDSPCWDKPTPRLPVDQALMFLWQPFTIFVENRRNDQAFLKAVAAGWRKQRLLQLLEKNWIRFDSGGGIGEVLKWVQEISEHPEQFLRGFALFDSDALRPNEPSEQSAEVVTACGQNVHHHRLQRRAIENYLPIKLLELWMDEQADKKRKVRALNKFTAVQRHHFNMKKGFEGDFGVKKSDQETSTQKEFRLVGNFYSTVKSDIRSILERGFGDDIAELFKEKDFVIQESWLTQDGQTAEINPMLDKLLALI